MRLALLCFAVLAVFGLLGCGGQEEELLPGDSAEEILTNLESVEQLAAEGACDEAIDAVGQVRDQVESLPASVSDQLRRNLMNGVGRLREVTETSCGGDSAQTDETDGTDSTTSTDASETTENDTTGNGEEDDGTDGGEGDSRAGGGDGQGDGEDGSSRGSSGNGQAGRGGTRGDGRGPTHPTPPPANTPPPDRGGPGGSDEPGPTSPEPPDDDSGGVGPGASAPGQEGSQ